VNGGFVEPVLDGSLNCCVIILLLPPLVDSLCFYIDGINVVGYTVVKIVQRCVVI